MSDLKLSAEVTVDPRGAVAGFRATAAATSDAKVALIEAERAAKGTGAALLAAEKAGRAAGTGAQELNRQLKAETAAHVAATNEVLAQRSALALLQAEAAKAARATDAFGSASGAAAPKAGQLRASTQQLGAQISDISIGLSAGTSFFVIFGQQAGQVAHAMSGLGGAAGTVGTFLSGPWGAILVGATAVLGPFVAKLFDSSEAAKKAKVSLSDFQKQQLDIGRFIDATTGKLTEQNATLIRNAVLSRRAAIDENKKTIGSGSKTAFDAAFKAAETGKAFVAERQPFRTTFDPALLNVIRGAKGDVEKLDAGLAALAKKRPDLAATIKTVSDAAAETVSLARKNKELGTEIEQLSGKVVGARNASAGLIEKEVALATATSALERARARYNLVLAQGDSAVKAGAGATAAYRQQLTAAANAVNAAEAAEARAGATKRQLVSDTRLLTRATAAARNEFAKSIGSAIADAEKATETDLAAVRQLESRYDATAAAARDYADEVERIAGLQTRGVLSPSQAATFRAGASAQRDDRIDAAARERAKTFAEELRADVPEIASTFGRTAGDGFNSSISEAASAIGQLIGGKAGSAIGRLIGGLQSLGGGRGGAAAAGGGFGTVFSGAFAESNKKLFDGVTSKLESVFGGKGGAFAATAGKAFAGAAQGQIAGSVLKGLGVKTSGTGSQLGGAVGALIPALGPFGGIIGGAIGGVLGGLLKKTRTGSASIDLAGGTLSQSTSGNNAALRTASSARANSVVSGLEAIAAQFGGELGSAKVSIGQRDKKFVVDTSGSGRTKGAGTTKFASEAEAVQAALADAIRDGGVAGVSPRIQAVLRQYADNVDKAVAEALKVASLEELLANDANPFASAFRDLERQNAARLDAAKKYGFDIAAIEAINAKDRAAALKATLSAATSSVRAVLDDFRFGSRATGSIDEQRSGLAAERDRLAAAVRGGDTDSLGALTSVVQQLDDLTKQAFGSTAKFAAERSSSVALLDELVRSVETRITAAATAAQASGGAATDPSVAKLTELNASADDQVALLQRMASGIDALVAAPAAVASPASVAAQYARYAR